MNSKQAKELSLPEFLGRLGYEPARIRGSDAWYTSPFRPNEHTPSFKIDLGRNIWFDHGLGAGGTIIDFVRYLYRTEDVARVLSIIADVSGGAIRPADQHPQFLSPAAPRERPVIESVGGIEDRQLEAYIQERAIPLDLARMYLQEVGYRVGDRSFRALGFANSSGGFEVRNAGFKGTIGTKDTTFLATPDRHDAAVFEGVFDFLSALAHYKKDRPASNVLVLNSVSLIDRAVRELQERQITTLSTFLDHDPAGQAAFDQLQEMGAWRLRDASGFYAGFKDANDFMQAVQRKRVSTLER